MKRATAVQVEDSYLARISIHALVKRATFLFCSFAVHPLNFNPRPREEGDIKCAGMSKGAKISIHALVKRATIFRKEKPLHTFISIHALVKRATYYFQVLYIV